MFLENFSRLFQRIPECSRMLQNIPEFYRIGGVFLVTHPKTYPQIESNPCAKVYGHEEISANNKIR